MRSHNHLIQTWVPGLRHAKRPVRLALALLFAVFALLPFAAPVSAHAALVRSEPAAGSSLEAAPSEIVLEFSEDLDPAFSRVRLVDSTNTVLNPGPGVIDQQNPRVLRLAINTLTKGSYTAVWRARSAADGHVTEGSVPFGVGTAAASAALIPPLGTPEPATITPPASSSAIRWLGLLTATLALGGLPFALFVWRPVYRSADTGTQSQAVDQRMACVLQRLVLVGGALFVLASMLFLIDQAAAAADVSLTQALGAPIAQLLGSRTGMILAARIGLTVGLIGLSTRFPAPGTGRALLWWVALALGAAIVLTFSLNSHAAAEQQNSALAIALDWLHVAATVVWIGGLVPLAFALWPARRSRDQTVPLGKLIPRFSVVAIIAIVVLAASGLYSYFLHVGSPQLLLDTTYGRSLILKLVLFVLLIGLGAWNFLVLSPGLRKANTSLARSFGRTIAVEVVLGGLVLLAVGAMTSIAPSKEAWAEQQRLGLVKHATVDGVDLRVQVAPAQIGDNEFAVDVHDNRPNAQDKPAKVLLRFEMAGMNMGQQEVEMQPSENQRYLARGSYTSMGGRWHVEVIFRRAGLEDVRQTFDMDIVKASQP